MAETTQPKPRFPWSVPWAKDYTNWPQFPPTQITSLIYHDYWDGPLTGLCVVEGRKELCWYRIIESWEDLNVFPKDEHGDIPEDFEPDWRRRYLVHALTHEQADSYLKQHHEFMRRVGRHPPSQAAYEKHVGALPDDVVTSETRAQYFSEQEKSPFELNAPVTEQAVLGWYEVK